MRVRRLRVRDVMAAKELVRRFKAREVAAEDLSSFLSEERNYLLVAERQTEPLGFLLAYRLDRIDGTAPKLFLYDIGVAGQHRRKSVARSLIEALRELAASAGCQRVFVLTNRSNEAAVALYRSTGAEAPHGDDLLFEY